MTTFSDIFKNSFLETGGTLGSLTASQIILSMGVAILCAVMIYCFYRFFYRGVVYNHNFNILIVMTCTVTCLIIMTISSNIVLSLGMVGALSIVRFRAAVKDPLDVGFLFWAVAVGITAGAGLYLFAVLSTLLICVLYAVFTLFKGRKNTYLIIVGYEEAGREAVERQLEGVPHTLRNKSASKGSYEVTIEIKANERNTSLVDNLSRISGVGHATLVQYNGDFEG